MTGDGASSEESTSVGSFLDRAITGFLLIDNSLTITAANDTSAGLLDIDGDPVGSDLATIDPIVGPEVAEIVVDPEGTNLEAIMPELENIQEQMGALGGAGGGQSDVGGSSGGLFDGVKSALGLGGGGSSDDDYADRAESARQLAGEYGRELQSHLESKDRWAEICAVAAAEADDADADASE